MYKLKFTNFQLYYDINHNLHPALQRVFLGCQFLLLTIYTLSIIHLVYLPHFWGITFIPRCTREMWKWWIIPFFFYILKNFVVWCTVFFKAFSEILYNNIGLGLGYTADTDRANCFMLSCWTPLLLGTENEGVILPLLWWSSIAVINNGSDTGFTVLQKVEGRMNGTWKFRAELFGSIEMARHFFVLVACIMLQCIYPISILGSSCSSSVSLEDPATYKMQINY